MQVRINADNKLYLRLQVSDLHTTNGSLDHPRLNQFSLPNDFYKAYIITYHRGMYWSPLSAVKLDVHWDEQGYPIGYIPQMMGLLTFNQIKEYIRLFL